MDTLFSIYSYFFWWAFLYCRGSKATNYTSHTPLQLHVLDVTGVPPIYMHYQEI